MRKKNLFMLATGVAMSFAVSAIPVSAQAESAVKVPEFEGPIEITETSHPFTVGGTDLEGNGYVLEEYYVSGTSNVYDWGEDGTAEQP